MRALLAGGMLLLAGAGAAEPMTGEEFDALSRGTTMHFTANGQPYGSEQFFSDHRTVWRADDGSCINGKWRYEAPEICFVYDNGSGPFCWILEMDDQGLRVTSSRNPKGEAPLVLRLAGQDTEPILCTGPLFGVAFRP